MALVITDAAVSSFSMPFTHTSQSAHRIFGGGQHSPAMLGREARWGAMLHPKKLGRVTLRGGRGTSADGRDEDVTKGDFKQGGLDGNGMTLDAGSEIEGLDEVSGAHGAPMSIRTPIRESGVPTAALKAGFASVVKVFAWTTEPHFSQPWQMKRQRQVSDLIYC